MCRLIHSILLGFKGLESHWSRVVSDVWTPGKQLLWPGEDMEAFAIDGGGKREYDLGVEDVERDGREIRRAAAYAYWGIVYGNQWQKLI